MKLWRQFIFSRWGGNTPVSGDPVHVQFTGEPPANPSEDLIRQIVGRRRTVSRDWLEEQIADALYYEGLRQGGWLIDIGIWGPAIFRKEAACMLADIRPDFGFLLEAGQAGSGGSNHWGV